MNALDYFDFGAIPWHVMQRFIEILPDSERIKFKSTNKLSYSLFLNLRNSLEIAEESEIVVDWFSSQQSPEKISKDFCNNADVINGFLIITKKLSIVCPDFSRISRKPVLSDEMIWMMILTAPYLKKVT